MRKMNYWLLPDPHLGHRTMVSKGYRPAGYEGKIFRSMEKVPPDDIIIVMGDFIFDKRFMLDEWLDVADSRNIWLIRGNHDNHTLTWYYQHGFSFVADEVKVNIYGINLLITHIPVCRSDYDINLHAHTHGNDHRDGDNLLTDRRNLAVDIEGKFELLNMRSVVQSYAETIKVGAYK